MLLTIPAIALLAGTALAMPPHPAARKHASKEVYAKRQTSRSQIMHRAHLKETVKLVEKAHEVARVATRTEAGRPNAVKRVLVARASEEPEPQRKRHAASRTERRRALVPRASEEPEPQRRSVEERGEGARRSRGYPACSGNGAAGYAHYPGWHLLGDDLSGAVPIGSEAACVNACNKYGGSCSGIYFDADHARCYLKGTHTGTWDFIPGADASSTNLIGSCAMWSSVVPGEMDAACCSD